MKRNMFKKLFVMLFVVMLFTLCTVSTNVQAASKFTLEDGEEVPKTIYVGQTYNLSVGGMDVKFYSRNKSVATIGIKTGELEAIAPGTAEIIARSEESGKVVAKYTIEVRQRATSITTDVSKLYLSKGEKATIKATLNPENSTDVIRFATSDKTIATVDEESGEVTAMQNGIATITVYAKDNTETDNKSADNKVAKVMVYVDDYLKGIQQVEVNKFVVSFGHDISQKNMKASDFIVKGKKANETYPVEKVEMDKDKDNQVILTTFWNFRDGGVYSIEYKNKSVEFTATDSKVAKLGISPTLISCEDEIPVYIVLYDKDGIVLERKPLEMQDNIEVQLIVEDGYAKKNLLYFSNAKSNADVKVIYHSTVYKDGLESGNITTDHIKINAISKDETVESGLTYTISNKDEDAHFQTNDYKQNKILAMGDQSSKIYFYMVNSIGKEYDRYEDYTFTSSDDKIFKLSGEISNTKKNLEITPLKEGTANIVVTNKATQKEITTIPITVQPKRIATTISLERKDYTAHISKSKKESESFTIHILDQYGKEMNADNGLLSMQIKVSDAGKVKDGCPMEQRLSIMSNKVTIYTADSPKTTYTYKVQYMKLDPVYFKVKYMS